MIRTILFLLCATLAFAQESEIRKVMKDSEDAWNRGDLVAFASYYEDSPDTTFMGKEVTKGGTKAILDRYQRSYPTPESRGKLTFSELVIRPLADGIVLTTGKFALDRTPASGGPSSGRFTLILKRTNKGWKIIHDHTS